MADKKTPITKTDLNVISEQIVSLRMLMENELSHQADDIADIKNWRDYFTSENGPWRRMDDRVKALEYLARSVKVATAFMAPVAAWAVIEIIKTIGAFLRGGP